MSCFHSFFCCIKRSLWKSSNYIDILDFWRHSISKEQCIKHLVFFLGTHVELARTQRFANLWYDFKARGRSCFELMQAGKIKKHRDFKSYKALCSYWLSCGKLFMAANEWSTITWLATYRFVRSPGVHVSPAARVAGSDDTVMATGLDEPRGEFTAPAIITCTSRNTVQPIVVLTPPADLFAHHRTRRASENPSFFALCHQLLFIFKTWQCLLWWANIPTLQRTYCASVANIWLLYLFDCTANQK